MALYRTSGANPTGDAVEANVLSGKIFSNDSGTDKVGTMPNNGAVSPSALSPNGSYTIPEGYHNGNGVVTASPNTGTYTPTQNSSAIDMGISNLIRYINTNTVYDLGKSDSNARTLFEAFRGFGQFGANDAFTWDCEFTPIENTGLLIVFAGASDVNGRSANAACTVTIGGVNQNFNIAQTYDSGGYGRNGVSSYIVNNKKTISVKYRYTTPSLHTGALLVLWIHP